MLGIFFLSNFTNIIAPETERFQGMFDTSSILANKFYVKL